MSLDELIFRLKHSDRSAFDEVYTAYYAALVNYATLMVSRETAEDIVHDVFLRLWNNRVNLVADTGCGNVRAYLYRSVYNACVGVIRRRLSKLNHENWLNREMDLEYEYFDIDRNETLRSLYDRDIHERIDNAVAKLPAKCREVFLLSYVDGLSNKEIAGKLSLSVSTVENHIHNALVRLRALLKNVE